MSKDTVLLMSVYCRKLPLLMRKMCFKGEAKRENRKGEKMKIRSEDETRTFGIIITHCRSVY